MPLQQPISTISGPTGGPLGRDRENTFNSIKNQGSAPSPLGNLGSPQGSQPSQVPQAPQGPGVQPSIPLVTPQKTTARPKEIISRADQLGITVVNEDGSKRNIDFLDVSGVLSQELSDATKRTNEGGGEIISRYGRESRQIDDLIYPSVVPSVRRRDADRMFEKLMTDPVLMAMIPEPLKMGGMIPRLSQKLARINKQREITLKTKAVRTELRDLKRAERAESRGATETRPYPRGYHTDISQSSTGRAEPNLRGEVKPMTTQPPIFRNPSQSFGIDVSRTDPTGQFKTPLDTGTRYNPLRGRGVPPASPTIQPSVLPTPPQNMAVPEGIPVTRLPPEPVPARFHISDKNAPVIQRRIDEAVRLDTPNREFALKTEQKMTAAQIEQQVIKNSELGVYRHSDRFGPEEQNIISNDPYLRKAFMAFKQKNLADVIAYNQAVRAKAALQYASSDVVNMAKYMEDVMSLNNNGIIPPRNAVWDNVAKILNGKKVDLGNGVIIDGTSQMGIHPDNLNNIRNTSSVFAQKSAKISPSFRTSITGSQKEVVGKYGRIVDTNTGQSVKEGVRSINRRINQSDDFVDSDTLGYAEPRKADIRTSDDEITSEAVAIKRSRSGSRPDNNLSDDLNEGQLYDLTESQLAAERATGRKLSGADPFAAVDEGTIKNLGGDGSDTSRTLDRRSADTIKKAKARAEEEINFLETPKAIEKHYKITPGDPDISYGTPRESGASFDDLTASASRTIRIKKIKRILRDTIGKKGARYYPKGVKGNKKAEIAYVKYHKAMARDKVLYADMKRSANTKKNNITRTAHELAAKEMSTMNVYKHLGIQDELPRVPGTDRPKANTKSKVWNQVLDYYDRQSPSKKKEFFSMAEEIQSTAWARRNNASSPAAKILKEAEDIHRAKISVKTKTGKIPSRRQPNKFKTRTSGLRDTTSKVGRNREAIRKEVINDIKTYDHSGNNKYLYHETNDIEGIIKNGLRAGNVSVSPLGDSGLGEVVQVFKKSDFTASLQPIGRPKPVATFMKNEIGVESSPGFRAEELGIEVEPPLEELVSQAEFTRLKRFEKKIMRSNIKDIEAAYKNRAKNK